MDKNKTSKITIQESAVLVPPGKSKRLAALRQQAHSKGRKPEPEDTEKRQAVLLQALDKEAAEALNDARARIQRQIERIKKRYPPGRQNRLFVIRYGDPEELKHKSLKEIFALLGIDPDLKHFKLIERLDFDGNVAVSGNAGSGSASRKTTPNE
ncbi:MAG: hypothetical protein ACU83N_00285 [Gammaproteobacteria bacterium]